ncbi:MAG: hypothetical protein ACYDH3_00055 [Candidatus Aminicenantales bacterium]
MTTRRHFIRIITWAALALMLSVSAVADISKRPFGVRYVPPGTNTLSEAARGLMDGGALMLGVGRYEQTEQVLVPAGVTSFEIIGMGPGSTHIRFTSDSDGITTVTTGDFRDMIERCRVENLSIECAGSSGERTAVRVWSSETNVYINPSVSIRNITIDRVDGGGYWGVGIDLIGAKEFIIDDVHIRHMPRLNAGYQAKGVGVRLQSCVVGSLRDVQVNEAALGVEMVKADDRLIIDGNKHGCEGITLDSCVLFRVVDGVSLGHKSLNILLDQCTIGGVQRYAIYETGYDPNGGFHSIKGGWFDSDPTWCVAGASAIHLVRPGSVIDGVQITNNSQAAWNGVTFGPSADFSAVDKCLIRGCGYAIIAQAGKSTISRNKTWGTSGASILLMPGSGQNVVGGNITDRGVVNQGQGNKVVDNMGY